jgi:hypothetical protein
MVWHQFRHSRPAGGGGSPVRDWLLNKQVGGELGMAEITVKAHRGQIMRKMKAASFADLVNMGTRLGLTSTPKPSSRGQP